MWPNYSIELVVWVICFLASCNTYSGKGGLHNQSISIPTSKKFRVFGAGDQV